MMSELEFENDKIVRSGFCPTDISLRSRTGFADLGKCFLGGEPDGRDVTSTRYFAKPFPRDNGRGYLRNVNG